MIWLGVSFVTNHPPTCIATKPGIGRRFGLCDKARAQTHWLRHMIQNRLFLFSCSLHSVEGTSTPHCFVRLYREDCTFPEKSLLFLWTAASEGFNKAIYYISQSAWQAQHLGRAQMKQWFIAYSSTLPLAKWNSNKESHQNPILKRSINKMGWKLLQYCLIMEPDCYRVISYCLILHDRVIILFFLHPWRTLCLLTEIWNEEVPLVITTSKGKQHPKRCKGTFIACCKILKSNGTELHPVNLA